MACVTEERSWTIAILTLHSQDADLSIVIIIMHANIQLLDLLDCFHYILNPPPPSYINTVNEHAEVIIKTTFIK